MMSSHDRLTRTPGTVSTQGTVMLKKRANMTPQQASVAGKLGKADLHMHSTYSDGIATIEQVLVYAQQQTDLDVIAITDHDEIAGALRARDVWTRCHYRFDLIVGEEVTTKEGHLLGLFLEERIPAGLSMEQSLDLIHDQGGLAVVAHPLHRFFRQISCQKAVMDRIHASRDVWFDGIETWNASFCGISTNPRAMEANRTVYGLPELGSSDAHTLTAIGCGFTWFEGKSAHDVRRSIEQGVSAPSGKMWDMRVYYHWARYKLSKKSHQVPTWEEERTAETQRADEPTLERLGVECRASFHDYS